MENGNGNENEDELDAIVNNWPFIDGDRYFRNGYSDKQLAASMSTPGYRFCPTDAELIWFYLKNKVYGQFVFPLVHDVQLYDHHPKILTDKFKRERVAYWYFFSPRNRKYRNGRRPDRAAGQNGSWKPTGINAEIKKPRGGLVIGYRRSLDYYEGKNKEGTRTEWKMYEYTLNEKVYPAPSRKRKSTDDDDDPMKLDEWVLCKVYNTRESRKDRIAAGIN